MTGGSKSTSGSAQKWARPYATAAAGNVQSVVGANAGGLQKITDQVQGLLPDLVGKFTAGDSNVNAARGYNASVLSGKYMQGNPYLQGIIDQTGNSVRDNVNAAIGSRGGAGGSSHASLLAQKLAEAENQLRYSDYNAQQSRMDQAAAQAPAYSASENASLEALLRAAGVGAELPYAGINALSGGLSALFNGGTQKGPGLLSTILGSAAQGAGNAAGSAAASAAAASDPRLKENIIKVGELEDGLGVYRWNYIWDEPDKVFEGVMADEVAELRPWALGPEIEGYMTVNYSALEAR